MKAIILAAWEGTRLRPFTNTIPKPMIKIVWKPILEHNLETIYKHVVEIVIVVKYKSEIIKDYFWNNYKWVPITYHEQVEKNGTAAAIMWIEKDLDVFIMNADTIFDKTDIETLAKYNWYWVLVKQVTEPEKYGIFKTDSDNNIREIIEKPVDFVWNLASLWIYKFNCKIIELSEKVKPSIRWEYEITDAINKFVELHPLKAIEIKKDFIDVGYPWDILSANKSLLSKLKKSEIKWEIEPWVNIKWNIILEEWAILKSWTYIEWNCYIWKNTKIWPNAYLRWETSIWDNCKIWNAVEVKNSSISDNTNIAHLSYIWDSILGNNINIGWWFITANLRHDKWNIKVPVKWVLTDTWLYKLGIIIWDNCKTAINSSSMPWRVLENNTFTNPGTIIK